MNTDTTEAAQQSIEEYPHKTLEETWRQIKGKYVKYKGSKRKIKVRKYIREVASSLSDVKDDDGNKIDHYNNLKKAMCLKGLYGIREYLIELKV